MKTEIYYFSGTGNSLYISKQLQKRIPGSKLIPIISLLNKNVIQSNAENVGFVFPVHLIALPIPVRKFLNKINLTSAKYIFTIMTCIGIPGPADIYVKKILKQKGKNLDSYFILKMANNSPAGLRPFADKNWINDITKEKISAIENKIQIQLCQIIKSIGNKEKYPRKTFVILLKRLLIHLIYYLFLPLGSLFENSKINFYADDSCNGCGICEKVCLSEKIKLINKKPQWQNDVRCYFCYACFNICPQQSILIKNIYTDKNGRYIHPDIKTDDIARQKQFK